MKTSLTDCNKGVLTSYIKRNSVEYGHWNMSEDEVMKKSYIFTILFVAGLILLFLGYNEANHTANKIGKALTGSFSNTVLAYYISGGISLAISILGFTKKI